MHEDKASQSRHTKLSERVCCPSCSKTFSRRTHMLRHAKQHNTQKPFRCQSCSREFVRSETLRDHYSRCEYRSTLPIPACNPTGRKKYACNECTRLKVKCNDETPCLRCKRLRKQCVRSKEQNYSDSDIFPGSDLNVNRHSVQFLLKDSGGGNFADHFPKSKIDNDSMHAEKIEEDFQMKDPEFEDSFNESPLPSADLDFESLFEGFDAQTNGYTFFQWPWVEFTIPSRQHHGDSIPSLSPNNPPDALGPRSAEMKGQIYNAITNLNIPEDMADLKLTFEALEILTPEKIQAFVRFYFQHWHRHGPIIHEPSFDPSKVALPLLISVFAIGGMYSKDHLEVSMMKLLLDFMEIVVYTSIKIEDDYEIRQKFLDREDEYDEQRQLEEFQGAYLMVVVQYWAGNAVAKKRVRQQRFMRLVSIARSRQMLTMQHHDNIALSNNQEFRSWVRQESLLRTINIMITLDNAFGIFNNLPPRFSWSELGLELPCKSEAFETTSYEDMRDRSLFPQRKLKVTEAFQLFFLRLSSNSKRFDHIEKGALNMLDLQIIAHLFYTFIWQQLFGNPVASVLPATIKPFIAEVKLALYNWKKVWDEVKNGIAPADMLAKGFPGSAETYWFVTLFVIHSFENKKQRPFLPIRADLEDTGAHLKPAVSLIQNQESTNV